MHSVIAFEKNVTLTPTTVKHYTLGFVSSTGGPTNTDLINQTKKAWKFAFGWQDFVSARYRWADSAEVVSVLRHRFA